MYKKIAGVRDADDEIDIIDEMIDRFGEIPSETMNLIKISRIKALAGDCGFARIVKHGNKFDFFSQPGGGPQPRSIAEAADRYGTRLLIHGGVNPMIRYTAKYLGNIRRMLEELVGVLESFL